MKQEIIPTHQFYDRLERSIPFDLIELKEKSSYDPSEYHRHAYYEIFFLIKGGGKHSIDFETFEIESNSIHFVSPGQIHLLQRALNSNGYVILFSREFYQLGLQNKDTLYEMPFLNNNTQKPIVQIPDNKIESFKNLIHKMRSECQSLDSDKEEILRAYLNLLLLDSKRLFQNQNKEEKLNSSSKSELLRKFRVLIEKNFIHFHKSSDYAELLCVSAGHLNDVVHDSLGISASDLIHERMLLEIKRMLLHSEESVNEIAQILNFEDPSYFARFFKKQAGLSPKEFREESRKAYLSVK